MLLKVSIGGKSWDIFRLSDHISFGKNDTRFGWCSFPEGQGPERGWKEEIGVCVYHDMMGAWIPVQNNGCWLKMGGEPTLEDYAVLDGDGNHKIKTKVRLLKWLADEEENKLYLFDGPAYILNDDGKTIERL